MRLCGLVCLLVSLWIGICHVQGDRVYLTQSETGVAWTGTCGGCEEGKPCLISSSSAPLVLDRPCDLVLVGHFHTHDINLRFDGTETINITTLGLQVSISVDFFLEAPLASVLLYDSIITFNASLPDTPFGFEAAEITLEDSEYQFVGSNVFSVSSARSFSIKHSHLIVHNEARPIVTLMNGEQRMIHCKWENSLAISPSHGPLILAIGSSPSQFSVLNSIIFADFNGAEIDTLTIERTNWVIPNNARSNGWIAQHTTTVSHSHFSLELGQRLCADWSQGHKGGQNLQIINSTYSGLCISTNHVGSVWIENSHLSHSMPSYPVIKISNARNATLKNVILNKTTMEPFDVGVVDILNADLIPLTLEWTKVEASLRYIGHEGQTNEIPILAISGPVDFVGDEGAILPSLLLGSDPSFSSASTWIHFSGDLRAYDVNDGSRLSIDVPTISFASIKAIDVDIAIDSSVDVVYKPDNLQNGGISTIFGVGVSGPYIVHIASSSIAVDFSPGIITHLNQPKVGDRFSLFSQTTDETHKEIIDFSGKFNLSYHLHHDAGFSAFIQFEAVPCNTSCIEDHTKGQCVHPDYCRCKSLWMGPLCDQPKPIELIIPEPVPIAFVAPVEPPLAPSVSPTSNVERFSDSIRLMAPMTLGVLLTLVAGLLN